MILIALLGFFFLCVILMIPVAAFKMAKAKPVPCPVCETEIKLISNTAKCPNCKTKLFKHVSGEYRAKVSTQ